jgi:hypothetical protein
MTKVKMSLATLTKSEVTPSPLTHWIMKEEQIIEQAKTRLERIKLEEQVWKSDENSILLQWKQGLNIKYNF